MVKPERPTIPESNTLSDSTHRLTMTFVDATPMKASPEDVVANFDVVVKRMAGELKVSILWDRSHKYFPGLRTVVQFRLVG
ncbi:hypothetical protein PHLGIDRAFT_18730 [Phlebiopsis gigantea 11061_1 CR5-6]|uniref:Uncharacterized protein n=1 Tax=Phlebiopsis gigantea (strain 11061_1 CR5-6) TaxID=745531 RepID=A0A0C3PQ02_PHLG1|nr:hypothetical protein PHLGIDRAFT_18730 [Phlebiopsis gigantea 11061_1 CR5-6]